MDNSIDLISITFYLYKDKMYSSYEDLVLAKTADIIDQYKLNKEDNNIVKDLLTI